MQITLTDGLLDFAARRAERAGADLRLTDREWQLLHYLAQRPGIAVSREELLQEVWGYHPNVVTRTIDATVSRLRAKIEPEPAEPVHLVTVYGHGYRLDVIEGDAPGEAHASLATPDPGTTFVGRDALVAQLEGLLEVHRLVTLIGAPGIGKSRLAIEVGRRTGGEVLYVDLADATAAEDLAVQLPDPPTGALVLLDNVDLARRAIVAHLDGWDLDACDLRVVVTARQRLQMGGETVVRVDSLPVDDAVELFGHRARRVGVHGLDDSQMADVRALVERLDGIPLAVEYAAARSLLLPPATLLEHLDRGLAVLGGGEGAASHQATVAAAIQWTWHQLASWEQAAVSQLSVFEGGFGLEAAEAVIDLADLDEAPPLIDVLQALVDKCLCRRRPGPRLRWEVYTILREFAQERLTLHPHHEGAARRHGQWAVELAERIVSGAVRGPEAEVELGNLRAAAELERLRNPLRGAAVVHALGVLMTEGPAREVWERLAARSRDDLEGRDDVPEALLEALQA